MMRFIFLLLLFIPLRTHAETFEEQREPFQIFYEAIELAAKVDAYNAFCDQDSTFRTDFIERAQKDRVIEPENQEFSALQEEVYAQTMRALKDQNPECRDLEFLLDKLAIVKELKTVTMEINAAEPEEPAKNPEPDPL